MNTFAPDTRQGPAALVRRAAARRLLATIRPAGLYAAAIVALSIWILHGFLLPLLVACVTAIASWPLYQRFASCVGSRLKPGAVALAFTSLITVFVLAPLMLALGALVLEGRTLLEEFAALDKTGLAMPSWVADLPLAGAWLAERWSRDLARPGAFAAWMQRAGPSAFVSWAQSLAQFMAQHLLIVGFTILLLFYFYREGAALALQSRRALRHAIGERADTFVQLATRAVRASVNSMLVVALFDGLAMATLYVIVGVPHAMAWAAGTAALAILPFLGYAGLLALALKLLVTGQATTAMLAGALGGAVLACGDKLVRPSIARDGTRLRFVWVLIGCIGGFEALGLVGTVIGPVLLTLARELWEQRLRDLDLGRVTEARPLDAMPTPVSSRAPSGPSRSPLCHAPPEAG
ncbi:MAG TPA: AI-2E family transporter [Burkholderiaceae bacterium]|nr:AI-2E family transporter [Burkholderiaceae bacterium]